MFSFALKSEEARRTIPCQLGIDYGYSENEKVDIFGIDLPDDAPTVVFVHGGYWQSLNRSANSYVAKSFYKKGCKVMVVGYNLCPNVALEKIVEEIGNAVKFCLSYAKKIGCSSVAIGGHSAGAHLIATTFINSFRKLPIAEQNLVKTVFLLSGVYDLFPIIDLPKSAPLKLNEELARKLSPMHNSIECANKLIKFNVFVGKGDTQMFFEQAKEYREKLTRLGYSGDVHVLEGRDHCGIALGLMEDDYIVVRIVTKLLK